jgi:hypothetical protein
MTLRRLLRPMLATIQQVVTSVIATGMKGTTMRTGIVAAIAASGLAAATLGVASPALAAPQPGGGSAQDTVNFLEAEGYKVIVSKIGTAPLSQCTVAAVRAGRDVTQRLIEVGSDGAIEKLLYTTVYVDATC